MIGRLITDCIAIAVGLAALTVAYLVADRRPVDDQLIRLTGRAMLVIGVLAIVGGFVNLLRLALA